MPNTLHRWTIYLQNEDLQQAGMTSLSYKEGLDVGVLEYQGKYYVKAYKVQGMTAFVFTETTMLGLTAL